jgi:putative ABC transport system permease protein
MREIIQLSILQLAIAYVFTLVVFMILSWRKIPQQKLLLIATLRMSIQLVLVGYVLIYLFDQQNPFFTILILVIMQGFSVHTILSKFKKKLSKSLQHVVMIIFPLTTVTVLLFFLFGVVNLSPWYDAQYFVPLAGMIIGNALTGVSLALSQMNQQMNDKITQIEEVLILGGTPTEATKSIVDRSFSEAIVPTLNTMVGMGIVFLPGMMTGQILSGVSPLLAIRYQVAIMLGILGSVSLSVFFVLFFGIKTYFNNQAQIKK